ncbi:MAG: iron ABC transporter permease [Bacteroidota bacterium]
MASKLSPGKMLLIAVTLFFVVGYIVYPLAQLAIVSAAEKGVVSQLLSRTVLQACFNSVILSAITVSGSAVIGLWFAYTFHFRRIRFKEFFSAVILLPVAIPPMVGVMAFLFLLGDNGLLAKTLGLQHFSFKGWTAVTIIHLYSFYPLFFLFVGNAFKSMDSSTVEAAYAMGAGKVRTFFTVILPQLRIPLIGAALLTFMASMASFSAPFIFAGSDRFLTTEIYYSKINGDMSFSAMLSMMLTAISVICLFVMRWYRDKVPAPGKTKGAIRIASATKVNAVEYIFICAFCSIVVLPVISLVIISILPDGALMQSGLTFDFTLANYRKIFSENEFFQPFLNTVSASVVAVAFTILLSLCVAHILRGRQSAAKSALETIVSLPYGIPGTVIAICLILAFNSPSVFSFYQVLIGTFWILPIAYTVRNLPILTQSVKSGLHAIDPSVEEAAASLGASRFRTWYSVTLPLIYTSLAEGSLLVFINSFGEFVATVLLYIYATKTMSIEVYSQMRMYNNGMAATYGVLLFIIVITIVYISRRILSRSHPQM